MGDVTIQIEAENKQAVAEMDKTAASVRRVGASGSAAATGLNSASAGFKGLVTGLQRATTLFGAAGVIGGVFALVGMATRLYGIYKKLTEVNREYAAEARKAADEAAKLGMTAAGLEAVRKAAEEAGVPADLLNEKLKEYKEHTATFDDLAAAVGKSADELRRMQDEAERGSSGTAYMADIDRAVGKTEADKKSADIEKQGLREATKAIGRSGGLSTRGWDVLFDAAGGDAARVSQLYSENKPFYDPRSAESYGPNVMPAGRARYQARQAEGAASSSAAEEDRDFWARAARDAQDAADAIGEELEMQERLAAEATEIEKQRAARAKAAYDAEAAARDRESIQRQDAIDRRGEIEVDAQKRIDEITVAAPIAASAAASAGGFSGGSMNNQFRMAFEREMKRDAIEREKITLLAEINASLKE